MEYWNIGKRKFLTIFHHSTIPLFHFWGDYIFQVRSGLYGTPPDPEDVEQGLSCAKIGADKVFDFSLGNPNLEPPEKVRKTSWRSSAMNAPETCDMPNAGLKETREAVAGFLQRARSSFYL
jgi:hypothetical protein